MKLLVFHCAICSFVKHAQVPKQSLLIYILPPPPPPPHQEHSTTRSLCDMRSGECIESSSSSFSGWSKPARHKLNRRPVSSVVDTNATVIYWLVRVLVNMIAK